MSKYLWNGEPVKSAEFLTVRILDGASAFPQPWWRPFVGTERQAIKVTASWGAPFVIDNEDGDGYLKITEGMGMWNYGHKGLEFFEVIGQVRDVDIRGLRSFAINCPTSPMPALPDQCYPDLSGAGDQKTKKPRTKKPIAKHHNQTRNLNGTKCKKNEQANNSGL